MRAPVRLSAALLALSLLAGCGAAEVAPPPTTLDGGAIAYVPLDDRPDNVERAVYLAESLGYTLALPDQDLYATKLDGQPRNAGGAPSGDRAALYRWVLEREAAGCDRYILSLDQLLSGGLVNSRSMAESVPVALPDGTALSEPDLLDRLLAALAGDENNRVWLLDSVMRLAPTVGYGGFGLNEYNALREYGAAARPVLAGAELTVENIAADYPLSAGGAPLAIRSEEPLPPGAAEDYLAARERKLRLSAALLQALEGDAFSNFHVLFGIDDSSAEDSVQKNEIAFLRQRLREGDALLSGVDDLAFKAVAKLYLSECGWGGASVSVRYFGGLEDRPACAYDSQPLRAIVDEHLAFFGLTESSAEPDFEILVLTAPADAAQSGAVLSALLSALRENQRTRRPSVLMDAANNAYGTAFHDRLTREYDLPQLLAYAGFLDMAIVTGTALSHGVARYAWLTHTPSPLDARANQAFLRTLADSVIKDFCYRNTLRDELYAYVRDELGGSPDNFFQPPVDGAAVLERLESGMAERTGAVLRNFARGNFIVGLSDGTELGCGALTLSNYSFPWSRVFEFRMDIALAPFTAPHGFFG